MNSCEVVKLKARVAQLEAEVVALTKERDGLVKTRELQVTNFYELDALRNVARAAREIVENGSISARVDTVNELEGALLVLSCIEGGKAHVK